MPTKEVWEERVVTEESPFFFWEDLAGEKLLGANFVVLESGELVDGDHDSVASWADVWRKIGAPDAKGALPFLSILLNFF